MGMRLGKETEGGVGTWGVGVGPGIWPGLGQLKKEVRREEAEFVNERSDQGEGSLPWGSDSVILCPEHPMI